MKLILLINVKMQTIFGALTYISRINATSESSNTKKNFIFEYLSFLLGVSISCLVELSVTIKTHVNIKRIK